MYKESDAFLKFHQLILQRTYGDCFTWHYTDGWPRLQAAMDANGIVFDKGGTWKGTERNAEIGDRSSKRKMQLLKGLYR